MKIKIEWLFDSCDCETCGSSWAEGAIVYIDGQEIFTLEPHASCYDGSSWTQADVYYEILKGLGYTIEEVP